MGLMLHWGWGESDEGLCEEGLETASKAALQCRERKGE